MIFDEEVRAWTYVRLSITYQKESRDAVVTGRCQASRIG